MVVTYPEWTLQEAIYNAIEIWGDSYRAYWRSSGSPVLEHAHGLAEQAAQALLRSGSSLIAGPEHEFGFRVLAFLSEFESRELLALSLQAALAHQLNPELDDKAQRILQLSELVVDEEPPESVARYLRNISRCYVLGLDGEAVVMCRSALENAIKHAFARRPDVKLPDGDLEKRIRVAVLRHILQPGLERAAHLVRVRGNKAVHDDPEVTRDVLGTIRSAMRVLADLQGD